MALFANVTAAAPVTLATANHTGALMKIVVMVTEGIDKNMFPFLRNAWLLPIAFCMTLQFHHPKMGSENIRTLGKSIIVLQLYYSTMFGAGTDNSSPKAFTASCAYLFFDEAILTCLMASLKQCRKKEDDTEWPQEPRRTSTSSSSRCWRLQGLFGAASGRLEEGLTHLEERLVKKPDPGETIWEQDAAEEEQKDKSWNVYMDFRKPARKTLVVFFAQFGLFMYYLFELNGSEDDDDSPGTLSHSPNNVSIVKWAFAVALLMVAGDEETGPRFGSIYWTDKLNRAFKKKHCGLWCASCQELMENQQHDVACFCCMPPRLHILFRIFCDFSINAVARAVICGTAPIMLCVEGPLDFVKDATAVFFIIKLDDVEDNSFLKDHDPWNPLEQDSSYEVHIANDSGYKIHGLRELLEFPSAQSVKQQWEKSSKKKHLDLEMLHNRLEAVEQKHAEAQEITAAAVQKEQRYHSELQRLHGSRQQVLDGLHEDREPAADVKEAKWPMWPHQPELPMSLIKGHESAMSKPVPDGDEDF